MNPKIFRILLVLAAIGTVGVVIGIYLYNKPSADIVSGKAKYNLSTAQLLAEYQEDENAANTKYLNQVVQIEGRVEKVLADVEGVSVVFESDDPLATVIARMSPIVPRSKTNFNPGQNIRLKGKVTGYLDDVNLNLCDIVN